MFVIDPTTNPEALAQFVTRVLKVETTLSSDQNTIHTDSNFHLSFSHTGEATTEEAEWEVIGATDTQENQLKKAIINSSVYKNPAHVEPTPSSKSWFSY